VTVKRFRTKIVEIEALRWEGDNLDEMKEWTGGNFRDYPGPDGFGITAEVFDFLHDTWIGVKTGQWIVRGAKGEHYPCDDETFHWKYEEVKSDAIERPADDPARGVIPQPLKPYADGLYWAPSNTYMRPLLGEDDQITKFVEGLYSPNEVRRKNGMEEL
jgi:hypothetical protein